MPLQQLIIQSINAALYQKNFDSNPSKGPQTAVESGLRRGRRGDGGGGGRGKKQKIMFFHRFFNESLAKTRLKTFRQLR